ncbi:MAG: hypothetical protein LBV26_00545 [Bacteroidales bacterium]|nr:hypothetical protein [Bacteroidales bacterium]
MYAAAQHTKIEIRSASLQQTVIWSFCGLLHCSRWKFGGFAICFVAANSNLAILWFAATKQTGIWSFCGLLHCSKQYFGYFPVCCNEAEGNFVRVCCNAAGIVATEVFFSTACYLLFHL